MRLSPNLPFCWKPEIDWLSQVSLYIFGINYQACSRSLQRYLFPIMSIIFPSLTSLLVVRLWTSVKEESSSSNNLPEIRSNRMERAKSVKELFQREIPLSNKGMDPAIDWWLMSFFLETMAFQALEIQIQIRWSMFLFRSVTRISLLVIIKSPLLP